MCLFSAVTCRPYVTMQITFLFLRANARLSWFPLWRTRRRWKQTHITAVWVASLTLDCNGLFAIKAYVGPNGDAIGKAGRFRSFRFRRFNRLLTQQKFQHSEDLMRISLIWRLALLALDAMWMPFPLLTNSDGSIAGQKSNNDQYLPHSPQVVMTCIVHSLYQNWTL